MSEVLRFKAWDPQGVHDLLMVVPASDYDALAAQRDEGLAREAELQQCLAEAEKDAARYRWLRSTECWADAQREIDPLWIVDSYEDVTNQDGEMLDKSIDAAIALAARPGCADGEKAE